jgi:hypothetical protein
MQPELTTGHWVPVVVVGCVLVVKLWDTNKCVSAA